MTKNLEFKFYKDIFWYDGPLLSFGITLDNKPVLIVWCDENKEEKFELYSYIFIRQEDLEPFINSKKSYFDVISDSLRIVLWKMFFNCDSGEFKDIETKYFMFNYGPQKDSNLKEHLDVFKNYYLDFLESEKND